jgi:hydroxymethylpyrimidine pyrophosphatase-like HAD family hydrolase
VKFGVLALDYDGTIARHGELDPDVRAAIAEVRARGIVVLLVTGRILDDLRRVAGGLRFVDAIVAENGAVLAFPASGHSTVIGRPPVPAFLEELRRRGIRIEVGQCVVEADASAAHEILQVIRELELPLVLLFNRGRLMVLSQAISKATGLREALAALRLSAHNAIGIGDAENDHEMIDLCELGVAVSWGSAALTAAADEVLEGTGPQAVATYIRDAARSVRLAPERVGRRRLLLGHTPDGRDLSLAVRGRNVLVAGDPRSGKSWVTGLLCEQLILYRYCICVIDPEGDYTPLEALPGVVVLGGDEPPPRPADILRAMRHPDVSLVLDLSRLGHAEKVEYMHILLPTLAKLRRRLGIPHRIIVDEAHHFLHGPDLGELLDFELGGYTLTSYLPAMLHPDVLAASEAIVVSRASDPREIEALKAAHPAAAGADWGKVLGALKLGEAAVLPGPDEAGGEVRRFRLVPRLTSHVRHREKYLDVPVTEPLAFIFSDNGRPLGPRARTLSDFAEIIIRTPAQVLDGHLQRGDFSRWVGDVFGDHALASALWKLEEQYRAGWMTDINDAIVHTVRERYELPQLEG